LNQGLQRSSKAVLCRLPKKYASYSFEGLIVNDENREIVEVCKRYVLEGHLNGKRSMVFAGNVGTGKTRLAVAILRNMKPIKQKAIVKHYDGMLRPTKSAFILADMFFNRMNEFASQGGKEKVIRSLLNYDIILLDDLSFENFTMSKRENLYLLVNEFYLQEKPIFITMNFTFKTLQQIEPRVADRLVEMATLLKFKWKSFRK